jgi:hypothetical protein
LAARSGLSPWGRLTAGARLAARCGLAAQRGLVTAGAAGVPVPGGEVGVRAHARTLGAAAGAGRGTAQDAERRHPHHDTGDQETT